MIVGMDSSTTCWIDRLQSRSQRRVVQCIERCTQFGVRFRAFQESAEQRLQVEIRSSHDDWHPPTTDDVLLAPGRRLEPVLHREGVRGVHDIDQVVRYVSQFRRIGLGGSDVHATIDLHRVGTDAFATWVQSPCKLQGQRRLAPGGGAEDEDCLLAWRGRGQGASRRFELGYRTRCMAKVSIDAVDVAGKRVLVRVDFNVPLTGDGGVLDDRRIRMALPTIQSVLDRGGSLVLMSHLGRPSGTGFESNCSLRPVAERLAHLLPGVDVTLAPDDCIGPAARDAVDALSPGSIVLLENLRFHAGEKKNDPDFAAALAGFGDVYVNDAFGTAHRDHASMVGVPEAMAGRPRVAGRLLQAELAFLSESIEQAASPFIAVLGGAKVSDKLGAIRNLLPRVDAVVIGGGMAYTFLSVLGVEIGRSLFEEDMVEAASTILEEAESSGTLLLLPVDSLCATSPEEPGTARTIAGDMPGDLMGLDIGSSSVKAVLKSEVGAWYDNKT